MASGKKLTALKVQKLTKPGKYADGDGLYLQVRSSTAKSWLLRYMRNGKAHEMGLGPAVGLGAVSLAEARERAHAERRFLRDDIDPLERRAQERAARSVKKAVPTFEEVAETYIKQHEAGWKNPKHRAQWRSTLKAYAFPEFGSMPVDKVGVNEVLWVLEPIWLAKPETASRVRGRIESILDYAIARGWRTGDNPARWRGHMKNLLSRRTGKTRHQPALAWQEIGAFMEKLRANGSVSALALEFTILTAARTSEVLHMRWSEVDFDKALWSVPAQRMKSGRPHRVPLSPVAINILTTMKAARESDGDDFIFPGAKRGRPLSSMAMLMLLRGMAPDRPLTVHGFRSTFRDWCGEATDHPREVAEAALAHVLPDKTEAAYARGDLLDRRKKLMADWAEFSGKVASITAEISHSESSNSG